VWWTTCGFANVTYLIRMVGCIFCQWQLRMMRPSHVFGNTPGLEELPLVYIMLLLWNLNKVPHHERRTPERSCIFPQRGTCCRISGHGCLCFGFLSSQPRQTKLCNKMEYLEPAVKYQEGSIGTARLKLARCVGKKRTAYPLTPWGPALHYYVIMK
jgi:hypothetical protein